MFEMTNDKKESVYLKIEEALKENKLNYTKAMIRKNDDVDDISNIDYVYMINIESKDYGYNLGQRMFFMYPLLSQSSLVFSKNNVLHSSNFSRILQVINNTNAKLMNGCFFVEGKKVNYFSNEKIKDIVNNIDKFDILEGIINLLRALDTLNKTKGEGKNGYAENS